MADDGLSLLLSRLDEPVPVRATFTEALRTALHAELGFAPAVVAAAQPALAPVAAPVPVVGDRRPPLERLAGLLRPMTPRVALLSLVTLLLIACTVAGALIVVREWLSTGTGGIQYTNDFALTEVYRLPGARLNALQAGPDGTTLYALREAEQTGPPTEAAIVRLTPTADGTLEATDVVALESLRDPALWPAGTDVSKGTVVSSVGGYGGGRALSIAPNGDLFLSVGLSTDPERAPVDTTIVVIHPDGRVAPVLSLRALSEEGAFGHPVASGVIGVTASAPDLLWAHLDEWSGSGSMSLYEIVDPNADGDWVDRVVKPLVLPDEVPAFTTDYAWQYGGFVAEPSTPAHDRSSSALLPVWSRDGEYRLYRVSDPDRDGDATARGEVTLLFKGPMADPSGFPPQFVAPRVVDGAEPPIDETLVAGLTRMTRLSRITDAGVVDIVRAIPSVFGIAATRDGSIYLAAWEPDESETGLPGSIPVYRLVPLAVGATPPPGAIPEPSAEASGTASGAPAPSTGAAPTLLERHALTDGVPRIAAWYGGTTPSGESAFEVVFLGADGSGPADLLPGRPAQGLCPSVDGSRIAYWSDDEVPNESYLYVEDVGGGNRALVDETANMLACPFPAEAIATLRTSAEPWRVDWHPFAGEARELVADVAVEGFLDTTRDGRLLAVASGKDGRNVTVVDVARGEASSVAVGMGARVRGAAWSPDGTRLAVATGPWDPLNPQAIGRFQVWIVDRDGGAPRRLTEVDGRAPGLAWSTDGASLAVLARDGDEEFMGYVGKLFVVDVATGERRLVIPEALFAAWSPADPDVFAYASETTLYIEAPGAPTREIAGPTGKLCDVCSERPTPRWPGFDPGWSPDGRYLATGAAITGVVDVETGEYRVLLTDGEEALVYSARWWP